MIETEYLVIGETMSRVKPGFATPVFQTRKSNGIFIQKISFDEKIHDFIEIQRGYNPCPVNLDGNKSRKIGDHAYYYYYGIHHQVHIDTVFNLTKILYDEFPLIQHRPYLRRTIGSLLNDDDQIKLANIDIQKQTAKASSQSRAKQDDYLDVILLKTLSLGSNTTAISLPVLQEVALAYDPNRSKHAITSKILRWKDGSSLDGRCAIWENSNFRRLTSHGEEVLANKKNYLKSPEKIQKILDIIQQVTGEYVSLQ